MKNIKRIASLLLMFSLVLIPICEVDAAQPPLVFDFESEIIGDDIFDGVDKTNNVKIENGFYNMGGLFFATTGRKFSFTITVKNLPETANVYFGYIERTTNGRSEYFPDTPSESNSYSMETSSNSALRVIIKVENNGEVFYYNLVKDQFRFEGRKNELLSYKNVPEGFEVHNAAGAYTDLLEPYGNLKYGAKCITDEEEIQQRFGSFIDKYVGEEDTVSFFELFLCDGDGNVVDVPKEYQLMTTYEIDFPASHMYNFPVGGGWPSSIPRIYRWRNEAKVYDMTDDSSKLLAVIDGETYTDLKTLKFNHIPSGTFAVVNSGLEMAKYLKYEWIDENVIKIMPVGVQGESILFMSSYDRGGRYLSSTEPIAVPAKLNAASDLGNNSVIFNGYEFDVRQEPNAKKVRFFLWDSINRMEPICNSVEIELE